MQLEHNKVLFREKKRLWLPSWLTQQHYSIIVCHTIILKCYISWDDNKKTEILTVIITGTDESKNDKELYGSTCECKGHHWFGHIDVNGLDMTELIVYI